MIKYAFFPESNLLIARYIGDIRKESVTSFIRFVFTNSEFRPFDKLLLDCREAHILFRGNDLQEIVQMRSRVEAGQQQRTTVFLVDTPVETALISLLSALYNEEMKPSDFCYTYPMCIRTLGLELRPEELDRRIKAIHTVFVEEGSNPL
ncbi:MAG: hypothetical protein LWW85_06350 [Marinilabiliales bacterium]|nr:hypothetical protein [Marinilabiliales bacterium]